MAACAATLFLRRGLTLFDGCLRGHPLPAGEGFGLWGAVVTAGLKPCPPKINVRALSQQTRRRAQFRGWPHNAFSLFATPDSLLAVPTSPLILQNSPRQPRFAMVAPPSRRQFSRPARCRRYEGSSLYDASLIRCFRRTADLKPGGPRYSLALLPYWLLPTRYSPVTTSALILQNSLPQPGSLGSAASRRQFQGRQDAALQRLVTVLCKPIRCFRRTADSNPEVLATRSLFPIRYSLLATRYPYSLLAIRSLFPISSSLLPANGDKILHLI